MSTLPGSTCYRLWNKLQQCGLTVTYNKFVTSILIFFSISMIRPVSLSKINLNSLPIIFPFASLEGNEEWQL